MEEEDKVVVELLKNEDIRQFYETELRSLELAAFSIVLSALRAQGGLTEKRKETIGAIKIALNISDERHRAEIRRVASDERLCTIAERVVGDSGCLDWNAAGYTDYPLFPHFFQYPTGVRKPHASIGRSPITSTVSINKDVSQPESPDVVEEPFDPEKDGDYLLENGWTSDSDVEMVYAQRVDRAGSDTEEQKEATARTAALAAAVLRRKLKKSRLSIKMRNSQTSPDITAVSPTREESIQHSPTKIKKLLLSPVLVRGRKRKSTVPVKATGRKIANIPAGNRENLVNSATSSESSYASISALATKLGIPRAPGRGLGARMTSSKAPGKGRGCGSAGTAGIRKVPSASPRPKQSPVICPSTTDLIIVEKKVDLQKKTPKQRIKVNLPKPDEKPRKIVIRRNKKKINPDGAQVETNVDSVSIKLPDSQVPINDKCTGTLRNSFDDLSVDISLQCHESLNSPSTQATGTDDESRSLVNNNSELFGNYEAQSRLGAGMNDSTPRLVPPVPPVPVKPPRARAKGEVPAKMRHKASKHMFNHEENRQPNFHQPDFSQKSYTPQIFTQPTNSLNHFSNNFYSDLQLQMPTPPPGVNPPVGIRPRVNPSSSTTNFGFSASVISSNRARSPIRNTLPTPVFSTTLNSNSMHKKRTQLLLPSTYQTQEPTPGDIGIDVSAATASSLAVAARNRSSLYDHQRQGLCLNAVRPTGTPPTQVQRKAQPHILSSSKLHRPQPNPSVIVLSSAASTTSGPTSSLAFSPIVTTASLPPPTPAVIAPLLTTGIGSVTSTVISTPTTTGIVQVPVSVSGSVLSGVTASVAVTPVQNIQTSLQNFQTTNVGPAVVSTLGVPSSSLLASMPTGLGVNMNIVRGQGGSNIIFLQRAMTPPSSSMPIVTTINQTSMPPAVQVPARNTSRAVILRRGNISRPGNVMFVDVHKNHLLGSAQVPQLLQTARLISGSSDVTMLNIPTIVATSAGTVSVSGRKLIQTTAGTALAEPILSTCISPTKGNTVTDAYLPKPFRTVQQQQILPAKSVQVLAPQSSTAKMAVPQENPSLPVNYLTRLPTLSLKPVNVGPTQQVHNIPRPILLSEHKEIERTIETSPMSLVHFENDIVHEEEVNTSDFIEYTSPNSNNNVATYIHDPPTLNNFNSLNTSATSGSSSTDTASEGESVCSPRQIVKSMPSVTTVHYKPVGDCTQQLNVSVASGEREALPESVDIFQTALKSSGIDLAPLSMDVNETLDDQKAQSSNNPTSKLESHYSTMHGIFRADTSKSS